MFLFKKIFCCCCFSPSFCKHGTAVLRMCLTEVKICSIKEQIRVDSMAKTEYHTLMSLM